MFAPARSNVPFRPTLLALLCSLTVTAHAATESAGQELVLDNVNINAQAPTPSNALPRCLPADRSHAAANWACWAIRT